MLADVITAASTQLRLPLQGSAGEKLSADDVNAQELANMRNKIQVGFCLF